MDEGQIVVDSIMPIGLADITDDLARASGFSSVKDLLQTAKHGSSDNVYLIRFHYLRPGAWDVPSCAIVGGASPGREKGGLTTRWSRRRGERVAPAASARNVDGFARTRVRGEDYEDDGLVTKSA